MVPGREALLDDDARRLEDDEGRERQVAHDGATQHPRMLVESLDERRHVHHHPGNETRTRDNGTRTRDNETQTRDVTLTRDLGVEPKVPVKPDTFLVVLH